MKRILLLLTVMATMATCHLPAQDAALLEEQVKQLRGKVEDLLEDKANQKRQIEALSKEVQLLRDQQSSQPKGNYASPEDLRALARQVQEIENNRKSDYEKIANQIEKLGKASTSKPRPPKDPPANNSSSSDLPDKAIEHTIASGDTLSTIAAAYSKEKGVKITLDQIRKANPGVKDDKLVVGKKILVPLPDK